MAALSSISLTPTVSPSSKRKLDVSTSLIDEPSCKETKKSSPLNAMELLMMHLKRCKYLLPETKRLRNFCILCHDDGHVSASGVLYEDISADEWRSIIEIQSEQSTGMAAILASLGTSRYDDSLFTLTMLKDCIESYLCRVYTPEYATWYSTIGAGTISNGKQYQYVVDEKLKLCAKTESILEAFKSILTAYGGFPKDVGRRFIRHPSAPQFLWPVVHHKQLAFVEVKGVNGANEVICIGYYSQGSFARVFDVELTPMRIPDLFALNAMRTSEYDGRPHLVDIRSTVMTCREWINQHKIRHVFEAKGLAVLNMCEEMKTEEFKRQELLVASCLMFNATLARLDCMRDRLNLIRTALQECYTDKFNDVTIRHDQVKLSSELTILGKDLVDVLHVKESKNLTVP